MFHHFHRQDHIWLIKCNVGYMSMLMVQNPRTYHFSHRSPEYPARHTQVSGAVQIPPFSQTGSHMAKIKHSVHGYSHVACSNNSNASFTDQNSLTVIFMLLIQNVYTILHTYARRFLSTPHSIAHTHPDLLSSHLVPIVTGIDGKGTSCQSSPSDSTVSRIGQLTT